MYTFKNSPIRADVQKDVMNLSKLSIHPCMHACMHVQKMHIYAYQSRAVFWRVYVYGLNLET